MEQFLSGLLTNLPLPDGDGGQQNIVDSPSLTPTINSTSIADTGTAILSDPTGVTNAIIDGVDDAANNAQQVASSILPSSNSLYADAAIIIIILVLILLIFGKVDAL